MLIVVIFVEYHFQYYRPERDTGKPYSNNIGSILILKL